MTRDSKRSIEQRIERVEDDTDVVQVSAEEAYALLVEKASTGEALTEPERAAYPGSWDEFVGGRP
jgi:hypothetical protein